MMVIRATETEIDLSGLPVELREIATCIGDLAPATRKRFPADQGASAEPYDRLLKAFEVVASSGAVKITIKNETLIAAGAPHALQNLASFLEFDDATPRGHHHHYDWYPGNEFIVPDSKPLVISVGE